MTRRPVDSFQGWFFSDWSHVCYLHITLQNSWFFTSHDNIQAFCWWEVLMPRPACDPLIRVIVSWQLVIWNDTDMSWFFFFAALLYCCDSCRSPLSLFLSVSLTPVIQETLVGEAVCPLTCPALSLQEQAHVVPWRVSDAATPQGLCDPQ